ncbi:hypothetical protein FHS19_000978 [Paenibacillus rhizosphaerae]|uniref:Uncharacterized protein n=1 Tax=Paenibacillus rhizosphaerae TaxID=297318 RepID=A0A839TI27_9BACL|nr:hypothetical protein [Paenibacillus rhizosphaerae]MBB3126324.1 hypothetical protein [Paenibacillus rhizosphaerae]
MIKVLHHFGSPKWLYMAGLLVIGSMIVIVTAGTGVSKTKHHADVIATVNGVPIQVNEFRRAITANKAGVISYFYEKYDAEPSLAFWTTVYGGETPLEMLKKRALQTSVNIKIQQIIAQEQGVLQDIGDDSFVQSLQRENKRRQTAVNQHQVVFGPKEYSEEAYFEYVMTNAIVSVKNHLMEQDWKPDEQQLKQFYESQNSAGSKNPAFDAVKDQVVKDYIDNKYEGYVHERVSGAKVVVNPEQYDLFQM